MPKLIFFISPSALKRFILIASSCSVCLPPAREQAGQSPQKAVYLPVLGPESPSVNTVSCCMPPLYTGLYTPKPRDLPMANTDSGSPICLSLLAFFFSLFNAGSGSIQRSLIASGSALESIRSFIQ